MLHIQGEEKQVYGDVHLCHALKREPFHGWWGWAFAAPEASCWAGIRMSSSPWTDLASLIGSLSVWRLTLDPSFVFQVIQVQGCRGAAAVSYRYLQILVLSNCPKKLSFGRAKDPDLETKMIHFMFQVCDHGDSQVAFPGCHHLP